MCLSMVVIASLIGAKGLGQDVLIALQYAARAGDGWPVSRSCSAPMVIDRIIQGHYKRSTSRQGLGDSSPRCHPPSIAAVRLLARHTIQQKMGIIYDSPNF